MTQLAFAYVALTFGSLVIGLENCFEIERHKWAGRISLVFAPMFAVAAILEFLK